MTNLEKIKQMTAEEFAVWVNRISYACYHFGEEDLACGDCPLRALYSCETSGLKEWLESEADK